MREHLDIRADYKGLWTVNGKEFKNALYNEGEEYILKTYFTGETAPTSFSLGLSIDTAASLDEDTHANLAALTEATDAANDQEGYARQDIDFQWSVGNTRVESHLPGDVNTASVQFTCSGTNWAAGSPANYAFLIENNNRLIAVVPITPRVLTVGDTLDVSLTIDLD